MDAELRDRILALGDVDLVRLLTVQSAGESPEALALATDEAKRRGVPIDEGFIPRGGDAEVGGVRSDRLRWIANGVELVCPIAEATGSVPEVCSSTPAC